jgi:phosphoglucomutase/phosphomannomutase
VADLVHTARAGLLALPMDAEVVAHAADAFAAWVADPRHAEDLPQLQAQVEAGRFADLLDAFWQVIPFGTGGRRGPVGMGTNRFNFHSLLGSVQGHAELLAESYDGDDLKVVLAWDVRVYEDQRRMYDRALPNPLLGVTSAEFAARAAGVYAANGVSVRMIDPRGDTYMSTPELSLSIRRHGAHGGLNVSASHNHPDDNGGKFYNRHGGQDVPPDDEILAKRVEGISEIKEVSFDEALADGRIALLDADEENRAYLAMNAALGLAPEARGGRIVYSPLNGTGSCTVGRLLRQEGFDVGSVPEQEGFDGRFPTVKFLAPNPEQPSCYELAERRAEELGADVVMTTDPDADRIGLEVRRRDGSWRFITGDETLLLVVEHVLGRRRAAGNFPDDAFVLKTLVTGNRVTTLAKSYGAQVVTDLLVGFKYMADVLARLEADGRWRHIVARPESLLLGVEESHGVLMTHEVRDKDAAGPALALAELNALAHAEGRTLLDELDRIHATHGAMTNKLLTTVMTGAKGMSRIRAIQASLRADPPAEIAGRRVLSVTDMADPAGWMGPIKSGTDEAARNVLVFALEGERQVIIRPSGTEPKNKTYVEVPGRTPDSPLDAATLADERARCDAEAEELGRAFERLTLGRVGITLSPHAEHVSGLLDLDKKRHFGDAFLPELEQRVRRGDGALASFVEQGLASYGGQPRDLVRGGVASWLAGTELPDMARGDVAALFGLEPG